MSDWFPSEKPCIESDGWIHKRPADPKQMQAAKVINAVGFGIGMLLCGTPQWKLGLVVVGFMIFANLMGLLGERFQAPYAVNMCPKCHTRRPYSRYQEVCAGCGYRPNPKKESNRGGVTSIALVLMMPALALAQPRIPTGDTDKQPAPEASRAPAYGIEQPLFAPERMARDASPEHVKMMNSLSFASAVPVAVADAARIVADREAQRLVAAVWVSLLREYKVLKGEPYPDKTPAAFVRKDVFEILSRAKGGEGAQVHEGYAFLRWVVDTYGAPYQVYVPHPELSPETDIDVVEPGREAIEQMVNAAFEKAQQGVLQKGGLMEAIQRQQGGDR